MNKQHKNLLRKKKYRSIFEEQKMTIGKSLWCKHKGDSHFGIFSKYCSFFFAWKSHFHHSLADGKCQKFIDTSQDKDFANTSSGNGVAVWASPYTEHLILSMWCSVAIISSLVALLNSNLFVLVFYVRNNNLRVYKHHRKMILNTDSTNPSCPASLSIRGLSINQWPFCCVSSEDVAFSPSCNNRPIGLYLASMFRSMHWCLWCIGITHFLAASASNAIL